MSGPERNFSDPAENPAVAALSDDDMEGAVGGAGGAGGDGTGSIDIFIVQHE